MTRIFVVSFVWVALQACHAGVLPAKDVTPLNLVIIQTDEHHFGTLGCYGGEIVGTPNIDWIAAQGALCNSFYATTPVCSPSRAALVSGMYPQKTPVVGNDIPLHDSVTTFAEILKQRGYATGYAGKWHLDGAGKPQWAPERKFGFDDNRFMFNRGHWKKFEDAAAGPRVAARNSKGEPTYGVDDADEKSFSTDWLCDKVINFIDLNQNKPFCYMVALPDPHGPNTVRAPYDTMYNKVQVPIPVTLKKDPAQIPGWGKPANITAAQLRRIMAPYYGMVKCIDDNVGKIVAALKERDLLDNTIIVFTSDHGDLCGEHGRLNKGVPYEGSARIPFLIYCSGKIKPGTKIDQALGCVDFLPTVLALMDVNVPHAVDGRDASPLFVGAKTDWTDIAVIRSTPNNAWLCAATARYKLIYSQSDDPWLIDMQEDPNELTNVFGKPENRVIVKRLSGELLEYAKKHQDEYARIPNIRQGLEAGK